MSTLIRYGEESILHFAPPRILVISAAACLIAFGPSTSADTSAPDSNAHSFACVGSRPNSIGVTVADVRSARGEVTVSLWRDAATFLEDGHEVAVVRSPAKLGEMRLCIEAPEAGSYAITAKHDENGNGALDKNWMGIPTEPYGFANDPSLRFRGPTLEDSTIFVPAEGVAIEITLNH